MVASLMKTGLNKAIACDRQTIQQGKVSYQKRIQQIETKGHTLFEDAGEFLPGPSNIEPWVQFLQNKYETRLAKDSLAVSIPSKVPKEPLLKLPPGLESEGPMPLLQTSEYFHLLKNSESHMSQVQQKPCERKIMSTEKCAALTQKVEVEKAINRSISKNLYVLRKGDSGKKQGSTTPSSAPTAGSNDRVLRLLTDLISAGGGATTEVKSQAETAGVARVQDDMFVERSNRDQDLSEEIYWSEDERSEEKATDCRKASAHVFRRHFTPREYVMQDLDPILDSMIATLLFHLSEIQHRHRSLGVGSDKRRSLFLGLREVLRAVRNRKIKCVIVAPDILEQDSEGNGNHNDMVHEILRLAYAEDIPVIFALNRSRIGRSLGKLLRTSMIAILDAKGANDQLQAVIDFAYERRLSWLARKRMETRVGFAPAPLPPWRKVAHAA